MHSVFFGVKRAYWLGVRLQARLLAEADFWITPARFDLLYVLRMNPKGVSRFRLKKMLGVSGPVLSRMMRALEAEGLLERRRSYRDKRFVCVHATEQTMFLVDETLRALREGVGVEAWVRKCFASRDGSGGDGEVELFERYLERVRVVLEDPTPRRHPWEGISVAGPDGYLYRLAMPPTTMASIVELALAA